MNSKKYNQQGAVETSTTAPWYLSYPFFLFALVVFIIYGSSIKFGFTSLDDTIFINDFHTLFSDINNLPTLFNRGVFTEKNDFYYRPVLMISFMLDKWISGQLPYYHFINLIFHLMSVYSIFKLLKILNYSLESATVWSLAFALHPVLLPAVVWIPGRNDSMLTYFVVSAFYYFIKFHECKKYIYLIGFILFYFLALFTKETAVLMPVVLVLYILLFQPFKKRDYFFTIPWVLIITSVWYVLRNDVVKKMSAEDFQLMMEGLQANILLPLQYIGKVFLPFNLSVFPQVADTTMVYGWVAISFLIFVFIIQRKQIEWKWMLFGLGWFFVFLLPSLMVPKYINSQSFEHRLYLPMLGLVWCIQPCFKGLSTKYLYALLVTYCITFVWINFNQQKFYKNELKFWKQAVLDAPSSAYAHKILSVRYYTHNKRDLSKVEAQKALAIDSTEKYANYYLGKYYYDHEQWEQAYAWMLKELNHNPQFIDAVFDLARVSYELGNKNQSIVYLEQATMIAPNLVLAKQNLLLMYMELNQREKALAKIEFWKKNNEPLPDGYAKIVGI